MKAEIIFDTSKRGKTLYSLNLQLSFTQENKEDTMKRVIIQKIFLVIIVLFICNIGWGCAKSKKRFEENSSVETIGTALSTVESELATSAELILDEIKKQAEANAEKDRYFILEAVTNSEADTRFGDACLFIKKHYPDYFLDDNLIKKSIEYGYYLEIVYKEYAGNDNGYGRYYEMGKLVSESAQDIFMNVSTQTDIIIIEKMQKLEEQLQFFYGEYYGAESDT